MEESNGFLSRFINGVETIGLEEVTGPAGERQIRLIIRPAVRGGDDVFDLEREVEYDLGGAAILATVSGSSLDSIPELIG